MDNVAPALDRDYLHRREWLAGQAAGSGAAPTRIDYLDSENETWRVAKAALDQRWTRCAAPAILDAAKRLDLPSDRVPQLDEVTAQLRPRGGFEFRAVPGLVPVDEFFGSLSRGVFLSTQYVRYHGSPLYTPEPDILHEVIGHGTSLADPHLAMLHRQAGAAMVRLETEAARQFVADVFWFSVEFGVIEIGDGVRAYGAGLLSSVGELDWFLDNAEVRPLDINAMGTISYDIARYQPVLFAGRSLAHVLDVVGEFFATVTDDAVMARLDSSTEAT